MIHYIDIGELSFAVTYENTPAAKALLALLPLTLSMEELNGNEKYHYLDTSLPTNAVKPDRIEVGDLMLYGSSCVVLFYESFATGYRYTPLGRVQDPAGLAAALGNSDVTVTFR